MLNFLLPLLSLLPHNLADYAAIYRDNVQCCAVYGGLRHGIDPALVMAVIQVESSGNRFARNGGCVGLMQVNEHVWKLDERFLYDADYNIFAGCKILRHYLDLAKGDVAKALTFYNCGPSGKHNNPHYAPKVMRCYKNIIILVEMRKKYAIL